MDKFFTNHSILIKVYLTFFAVAAIGFIEIFYFNKDLYRNWGNADLDPVVFSFSKKFFLLLILSLVLFNLKKLLTCRVLIVYLAVFMPYAAYLVLISFNIEAALGALVKDIVPIVFIMFGYVYRTHAHQILKILVCLALFNNLFQIILIYPLQLLDLLGGRIPFPGSPFFRASGVLDVAAYEYLNFIGAITCLIYNRQFKAKLFLSFIFFGLLAFQAKSIPVFLLLFLVGIWRYKVASTLILAVSFVGFISLFLLSVNNGILSELGGYVDTLFSDRFERYISYSDSVRTISYNAAFNELGNGNIFGTGLGMFGGPQATIFQSPLYIQYMPQDSQLITSDTYYPHVLVEWGLLGFIVFFTHIFLPLFYKFKSIEGKFFYWAVIMFILLGNTVTFAYEDTIRGFIVFPLLFIATNLERYIPNDK